MECRWNVLTRFVMTSRNSSTVANHLNRLSLSTCPKRSNIPPIRNFPAHLYIMCHSKNVFDILNCALLTCQLFESDLFKSFSFVSWSSKQLSSYSDVVVELVDEDTEVRRADERIEDPQKYELSKLASSSSIAYQSNVRYDVFAIGLSVITSKFHRCRARLCSVSNVSSHRSDTFNGLLIWSDSRELS